jgi:eukaryotic-like serine/threonine-protein kinase
MTITPDTSLDHRYLLVRRLAFGGMGEVWEGVDSVLDRPVAVKILRAELADDDAFRRRFRAEARTASRVPHPGIASVYDYGETAVEGRSLAYLVMELVPGEALSAILGREGALGTDRTLDVVAQAARALHAAHEHGVVHRDVKPANLLVTPDGRVKVTDFGIARPDDHEPLTATGQVMGTAHYLAPELARGRAATPASDIYALGVVAYECLAGRRPFEGDDQIGVATAHLSEEPPPLPETLAPDVRALVAAAMEKDPQRRIGGADVLAAAAEALVLRLHGTGPGTNGMPANGTGGLRAAPTVFGIGAGAAGVAAAGALGPHPPMSPPPFGPAVGPPSGDGGVAPGTPPPGAATASGALLGADLYGDSPGAGYPGVYQRPPTAPLPVVGEPGSGGVRTRGGRARSVSLPMIALVGMVALVVIGTLVVALRQNGSGGSGGPSTVQNTPPSPTTHRPSRSTSTPSRSTQPVVGGASSSTTRAPRNTPSPTRTTRPTPSPSASTTPSPTVTTKPSPSPTPVGSGTTSPSPGTTSPSPSPRGGGDGAGRADTSLARAGLR